MKNTLKLTIPFLLLFFAINLQAFVLVTNPDANTTIPESEYFTVNEFLELTPATLEAATGKKVKWRQRTLLKIAQKRMQKKLSKGKIQLTDIAIKKEEGINLGFLSLIAGSLSAIGTILGLAITLTGPILVAVIALSVAAIVLGIMGLKKDNKKFMSVLGLVIGSLVLLFLTVAIAFLLAHFF